MIHLQTTDIICQRQLNFITMIDMLEIMFIVFKTRKESRGCFSRLTIGAMIKLVEMGSC